MEGRVYSGGDRCKDMDLSCENVGKVLVIDDSVATGHAIGEVKDRLKMLSGRCDIVYGAVYVTPDSLNLVDCYAEVVDVPRVFEWNLFHHWIIEESCVDIDGVLCEDPPVDDDGEVYLDYISNARPLYTPSREIHTIVSCRLEKYRNVTEKWLKQHDIRYRNLVMLPFDSKDERIKWGRHAEYKAETLVRSGCRFFIESSLAQAVTINAITDIPVFCTENFAMIDAHVEEKNRHARRRRRRVKRFEAMKRILDRVLPAKAYDLVCEAYHRINKNDLR